MKFINLSDKLDLKISIGDDIRRLIDLESYKIIFPYWPNESLFEVIALAQHYGTPTRFLDWSYEYKASLYFAIKDILDENKRKKKWDGILWGFNYKLFYNFDFIVSKEKFKLQFYRAEYNSNSNLNAQKGLFTFFINKYTEDIDDEFHNIIINQFKENDVLINDDYKNSNFERVHNLKTSDIGNEKVFYKILIPYKLKKEIFNELIKENYFTHNLFPGYQGVSDSIRNKVILDELDR